MESRGRLLRIIGNETRRRILALLSEGPHYVLEISKKLDVTQPAILKHLAILQEAGLVENYMRESRLGASRKYYVISGSVNLEIAIDPRDFRITTHPSRIDCPTYIRLEDVMGRLTGEINEERDLEGKAVKAQSLLSNADVLLACEDYDEERWSCKNCRRVASLRKRVSEIVIRASMGDLASGLHALTSIVDFISQLGILPKPVVKKEER
ncbi:MAG: ArsR/SmtB family transcription factor [Candidatus Bathyarchaeia archaeon]